MTLEVVSHTEHLNRYPYYFIPHKVRDVAVDVGVNFS